MDELMDMIAADDSASQISDKIKDFLYAKSAEKVDAHRPEVANSLFGEPPAEVEDEAQDEVDAAVAVAADEISGDAAAAREAGEE
tara:strand:+ start:107 stop:361 length:255 start_codon:yes stop_codon:yes gene_type:complete